MQNYPSQYPDDGREPLSAYQLQQQFDGKYHTDMEMTDRGKLSESESSAAEADAFNYLGGWKLLAISVG
jgi:hypothetical protein